MTIHFCMPFWGDPTDLRAAVAAVIAQTDPDWLLTVIDDCYPDPSVATFFAQLNDPRIDYRRNETNVGITENFRRAVAASRADYTVILGGDDLVGPEYVSRMKDAVAQHPDVDVFQGGVQVVDAQGRVARTLVDEVKRILTPRAPRTFRGEEMATTLLAGNWLYWPSLLFRTDTLKRTDFRSDLPIILDLALLVDIAMAGGSLHSFRDDVFRYRRHSESLSQKTLLDGSRFEDERRYYRDTAEQARALGWRRASRAARRRIMSRLHGVATLPAVLLRGSARARSAALALAFR